MEKITYSKENIEQMLNVLNSMSFTGFQDAQKIVMIFNILNSPIVETAEEFEIKK